MLPACIETMHSYLLPRPVKPTDIGLDIKGWKYSTAVLSSRELKFYF